MYTTCLQQPCRVALAGVFDRKVRWVRGGFTRIARITRHVHDVSSSAMPLVPGVSPSELMFPVSGVDSVTQWVLPCSVFNKWNCRQTDMCGASMAVGRSPYQTNTLPL